MKRFIIYRATSPSGKMYFGKTNDLQLRINNHRCEARNGSNTVFHRAIQKYGNRMVFEAFFSASSEENAFEIEKEMITLFTAKDRRFGYNLTDGGDGPTGRIQPLGERLRASKMRKGKQHVGKRFTEEHRRRISLANTGKKKSQETRLKISQKKIGLPTLGSTPRPVLCVETNMSYLSISDAQRRLKINNISHVVLGRQKTAGGFHWRYL